MDHRLVDTIKSHEGVRLMPYRDILGYETIGFGRCLDKKGISMEEALYLLHNDLSECEKHLEPYAFYQQLDEVRKGALIELRFNLGMNGLLTFKKFLSALKKFDYNTAYAELLDSKWARQVGKTRRDHIAYRILHGEYP